MKKSIWLFLVLFIIVIGCGDNQKVQNTSAINEQVETEINQRHLNEVQPPPKLSWSLERDNLIKRFKMMNDRSIFFYMYIFIEGSQDPIGYYQINKVSSVNSQLTNTQQVVLVGSSANWGRFVLSSPAEDGSYGTNGEGVFGFTPENIYIEHNMKYIVSSAPLTFTKPVNRLLIVNIETQKQVNEMMDKIEKTK
jgi:hypothetical protein